MNGSSDRLVRYLLGRADTAEREAIERESMQPDLPTFDELTAVEDELWIDYAQGLLSPDDAARFESRFLSAPGSEQRLAAARAFAAHVGRGTPASARSRAPWGRRAMLLVAAAEVVLVAGIAVAVYERAQHPPTLPASSSTQATPAATAAPSPVRAPAVALSLSPLLTRGGSEAVASADARAAASGIHFRLKLPAGAPRADAYSAAITDPDGRSVWSGTAALDDGNAVLDVRQALAPNDYQIDLTSSRSSLPVATYSFRVSR